MAATRRRSAEARTTKTKEPFVGNKPSDDKLNVAELLNTVAQSRVLNTALNEGGKLPPIDVSPHVSELINALMDMASDARGSRVVMLPDSLKKNLAGIVPLADLQIQLMRTAEQEAGLTAALEVFNSFGITLYKIASFLEDFGISHANVISIFVEYSLRCYNTKVLSIASQLALLASDLGIQGNQQRAFEKYVLDFPGIAKQLTKLAKAKVPPRPEPERAKQVFQNLPEALARPYSKEPVPDEVLTPENVSTAYRIQNAIKRRKPEASLIDPRDRYLAGRIVRAHVQRLANG